MGVPAIVPKDSTEPADALDSGSVLLTGPAPNHVTPSISLQLSSKNTASYPNGYSPLKIFLKESLSLVSLLVTRPWNGRAFLRMPRKASDIRSPVDIQFPVMANVFKS
jgi:hypothetical protein